VKYKTFFENSADAMLIIEDGEFMDCNPAAVAMLGYDRKDEICHVSPAGLSPEFQSDGCSSVEKSVAMIRQAKGQGNHRFDWTHLRKDGTLLQVEVSLTVVSECGGMQLHTVWRDITDRKQAELALRKSEESYRLLIENQTDLVVKVDLEGRFLFVNPSYCRMFGKTEEELLGNTFMPVVHTADQAATIEAMKALYAPPHSAYMEQRAMTKEGWRWLAWQDTAILDENGEVVEIIGVGRDITDRKQAEAAQRKSEERLTLAMRAAAVGIWEYDFKADSLYWDRQMFELYGVDPAEFEGNFQSWRNGVHPEDLASIETHFKELVDHDQPFDTELRAVHKDGGIFHLRALGMVERDSEGDALRAIGANWDITGQKLAEQTLRESKDRFQMLAEMLPEGIFEPDREFNLTYSNRYILEMFGYSTEDFTKGLNGLDMLIPEDRIRALEIFATRKKGKDPGIIEYLGVKANGTTFPILLHASPIMTGGELAGLRGIIIDVTEQKRAEDALADSETRFKALHNATFGGIAIHDKGIILDCNHGLSEITGYPFEELMEWMGCCSLPKERAT